MYDGGVCVCVCVRWGGVPAVRVYRVERAAFAPSAAVFYLCRAVVICCMGNGADRCRAVGRPTGVICTACRLRAASLRALRPIGELSASSMSFP